MQSSTQNKETQFFLGKLPPFLQAFLPRFTLFLLLFSLFLLPIIHANFHYNDDWFHIGSPINAMRDGRPVQQLALWIFSGFATTDIAPLFQITGTIFAASGAALASMALNYTLTSGILALSFLFCNEFFLENLSYRFESIGMGLALGLTLSAFYIPTALKDRKPLFHWLGVVGVLILAFGSYPPPVNLYGGLSCLAAIMGIFHQKTLRETWYLFISRMSAFAVALFSYRIIIAVVPPFHDIYAREHSALIHNFDELLSNCQLFSHFFILLIMPWKNGLCNYGAFLLLLLLLGALAFLYQIFLTFKLRNSTLKILSIFCFFSGIFLFFAGPMLLLKTPVLTPRVMCGVSIILTAAVTFLLNLPYPRIYHKIFTGYVIYLLYGAFVASAAYSNASHILENYRLAMASQIRDDLANYYYDSKKREKNSPHMEFLLIGDKQFFRPEAVRYIQNKYPIFQQIFIQEATWWTAFPAMAYDAGPLNLVGGGHYKDKTFSFIPPVKEQNPELLPLSKMILKKVDACDVNDIKFHSTFFTYQIDSYIVFDYDKQCTLTKKSSTTSHIL